MNAVNLIFRESLCNFITGGVALTMRCLPLLSKWVATVIPLTPSNVLSLLWLQLHVQESRTFDDPDGLLEAAITRAHGTTGTIQVTWQLEMAARDDLIPLSGIVTFRDVIEMQTPCVIYMKCIFRVIYLSKYVNLCHCLNFACQLSIWLSTACACPCVILYQTGSEMSVCLKTFVATVCWTGWQPKDNQPPHLARLRAGRGGDIYCTARVCRHQRRNLCNGWYAAMGKIIIVIKYHT